MGTREDAQMALAQFLGCEPDELGEAYGYSRAHNFSYGNEEYAVYDDYDDAERDAKQDAIDLMDDKGMESFSPDFQDTIIANGWLDADWFADAMDESNRFYAEDIESESSSTYANRLIEECIDADIISDDEIDEDGEYTGNLDLIDEYVEYLNNRESDPIEWFRGNYGEREMANICQENNLLDEERIAEECVALDGVAHYLARYDGKENEEQYNGETYYIYRTN